MLRRTRRRGNSGYGVLCRHRALGPGARLAEVFRFTMTVGFLGYGLAMVHESIWFNRKWSSTWKNLFDAVLYGAATAGVFVWLWPRS